VDTNYDLDHTVTPATEPAAVGVVDPGDDKQMSGSNTQGNATEQHKQSVQIDITDDPIRTEQSETESAEKQVHPATASPVVEVVKAVGTDAQVNGSETQGKEPQPSDEHEQSVQMDAQPVDKPIKSVKIINPAGLQSKTSCGHEGLPATTENRAFTDIPCERRRFERFRHRKGSGNRAER
jgi:hypothetical protein